ncbi:MAG TPA: hypothetical protein VD793_11210, partial [Gemmatimonadales bacterium]|nr:hypothetical protein [Gemmatimonadales bacterium]
MTRTHEWLVERRSELLWRDTVAAVLWAVGLMLAALALGVMLGRWGALRQMPVLLVVAWIAVLVPSVVVTRWWRRRRMGAAPEALAGHVEQRAALRLGSVLGPAQAQALGGSPGLVALADERTASWLGAHGGAALADRRRGSERVAGAGVVAALVGAGLLAAAGPGGPGSGDFWHPVTLLTRATGPVTLTADRTEVRSGEQVRVTIAAAGRRSAVLWERSPGEPWTQVPVSLDSAGRGQQVVGPLDTDRFLLATSGTRASDTLRISVTRPAFLADLQLLAAYPEYLGRADEPLVPGPDPILMPVGTVITAAGRSSVALASAEWASAQGNTGLRVTGAEFGGTLAVRRSVRWSLVLTPAGGAKWDEPSPELN